MLTQALPKKVEQAKQGWILPTSGKFPEFTAIIVEFGIIRDDKTTEEMGGHLDQQQHDE